MSGAEAQRNVLFVWLDSLSWEVFADCRARGLLPNLDEFAGHGADFSQAIAVATTTSPCTASLLTGLYTAGHGVRALRGYELEPTAVTLAEVLGEAGYRTVALVSGPLHPMIGLGRGFSEYQWREPEENLYDDGFRTRVEGMLRDAGEQPWFLFLHLWELHAPYWLPELGAQRRWYDRFLPRERYEQALVYLDQALGRLLAAVEFGRTFVVLMADHGEIVPGLRPRFHHHLNRRRGIPPVDPRYVHLGHGSSVGERLVRVPLIFRADGLVPAGTVETMVRQVDVAPSIAALCGVEWPVASQGRALLDRKGVFQPPPEFAFMEAVGRARASSRNWIIGGRTPHWKLVVAPLMSDALFALYDLDADPGETRDVLATHPEVACTIQSQIEDLLGASLDDLEWPDPALSGEEMEVLDQRLRGLGYL